MIELRADEKLLAAERPYWLAIAMESGSLLLASIVPFFFLIGLEFLPPDVGASIAAYRPLEWFLYGAWLLGLWMVFGVAVTNYDLDLLLVTTERVIDIEQKGLFSRDISELQLENIQDIRVEVKGLMPSLLNYGDLYIQTSAKDQEFSLQHVHDPQRVREIISKASEAIEEVVEAKGATDMAAEAKPAPRTLP